MLTLIPWTPLLKAAFFATASAAFVLAVMPGSMGAVEHYDKLNHILAFTVLAGLATFAFPRKRLRTLFYCLAVFGAAIELVQGVPFVHRDCSLSDWIADCLAAVVVFGLLAVVMRRRVARRTGY